MTQNQGIEQIVQENLDAYNRRNIDAFMSSFSDDAMLFSFGISEPILKGQGLIKNYYQQLFENSPLLKSEILKRIVFDNKVIDHESILGRNGSDEVVEMVLIYEIEDGEIFKITSIKK